MSDSLFYLSWWYNQDTKLGIFFNDFSLEANTEVLTDGLDYKNGMSASISEEYQFINEITRHPVSGLGFVSDHIIPLPNLITVTGIITSMKPAISFGTLDFGQLGNAVKLLIDLARPDFRRSNGGISLLTGLLYGKRFFRMDNLAVRSLTIPRTSEYGLTSIKFTMVLEQLILTSEDNQSTNSGFSNAISEDGVDLD